MSDVNISVHSLPCEKLQTIQFTTCEIFNVLKSTYEISIISKRVSFFEEGLRLANELCNTLINFLQNKINVKLATRLSSSLVAIEFLAKITATEEYIRFLDRVFDLINAKNPRGFKSPIRIGR